MNKCPLSVTVISWMFIALGSAAPLGSPTVWDSFDAAVAGRARLPPAVAASSLDVSLITMRMATASRKAPPLQYPNRAAELRLTEILQRKKGNTHAKPATTSTHSL